MTADHEILIKPEGRYHHGDLRTALLRATETLIAEHGTGAVSLREVARIAGVSHGAPAHHFGNKDGLMLAFAQEGWDRMIEAILNAVDADRPGDGPAFLVSVGKAYVRFAITNPGQFDVMFRRDLYDLKDTGYLGAGDSAWVFLEDTIQRCIDEGFAPRDAAQSFTIIAWSMVHGLAALWNSGRVRSRFEKLDPDVLNEQMNEALTTMMFPGRPVQK